MRSFGLPLAPGPIHQGRSDHSGHQAHADHHREQHRREDAAVEAHVEDDQLHQTARVHHEPELARIPPAHSLDSRANHGSTPLARHRNEKDENEVEISAGADPEYQVGPDSGEHKKDGDKEQERDGLQFVDQLLPELTRGEETDDTTAHESVDAYPLSGRAGDERENHKDQHGVEWKFSFVDALRPGIEDAAENH